MFHAASNRFDIGKWFPYREPIPTVHAITPKLLIAVYADEHAPMHFHIKTPDGEAQVWLDGLRVKENSGVSKRAMKQALAWAAGNADALAAIFNQLNPGIAK
ncbi:MAG: DUF4160 domain-containing protein [Pseudomonadota bacterium]|nr:DUF4160 domain-containing protein [Pseudomonadota bacterium]